MTIEGMEVRIGSMEVRERVVFKKCLTIGVALVNGMFFSTWLYIIKAWDARFGQLSPLFGRIYRHRFLWSIDARVSI